MTDLKAISTRSKAIELCEDATREVDLSGVEFVSSAFADELVKQTDKRGLVIVNVSNDVQKMLDVVRERRSMNDFDNRI